MTIDDFMNQIDQLSKTELLEIIVAAARRLETAPEIDEIQEAWNIEIAKRIEDVESGKAICIPAEQVHADIRKKHGWKS